MAISGIKNSGKTTLITALLPRLAGYGLRVAVIKHDGHSFVPEIPHTDTAKHLEAGAIGTAVVDREKCKVVRYGSFTEENLIPLFPDADLILLEGFKHSSWPKVEVVRAGNSAEPVCDVDTLLALVTDLPLAIPGIPTLPQDDSAALAALLADYVKGRAPHVG